MFGRNFCLSLSLSFSISMRIPMMILLLCRFTQQTFELFGNINFEPLNFGYKRPGINFPPQVLQVANTRSVKEILNIYGYPGEEYTIKTADGYLLEIQRIPNAGGKAILLMHGLRSSAANWVMMGPWSDLAYLLHDHGYDVWLANTRGTPYGQRHVKFSADQRQFWNFSIHEIGLYDTPAAIDFVINKSGNKRISYVGHSQGAAVVYMLTSLRPEYNKKIIMIHALAPAVYMKNLKSGLKDIATGYLQNPAKKYPYYGSTGDVNYSNLCQSNSISLLFCMKILNKFYGPSSINMTMTPVLLGHYPNQCGVRQIAHFYQFYKTGIFAPFYYSFEQKRRFRFAPYPLHKVKVPNVIFYCKDDYIVDYTDVKQLIEELPYVVKEKFVERCSHLDVIISTQARQLFYYDILHLDTNMRKQLDKK